MINYNTQTYKEDFWFWDITKCAHVWEPKLNKYEGYILYDIDNIIIKSHDVYRDSFWRRYL